MTAQSLTVVVGSIVEDEAALGVDELCQLCAVERSFIVELMEEGAIEGGPLDAPRFEGASLRRARVAARLRRDLGINAAGSALVLELLERLAELEGRAAGQALRTAHPADS
jgi:chaperone modulatory protein CbpM